MSMGAAEKIDPRTKVLFLLAMIVSVFLGDVRIVAVFSGIAILLMLFLGLFKELLQCAALYGLLVLIEFFLMPSLPAGVAMWFTVFMYFRLIFPISLPAVILVRTTKVRSMLEALRRMKLPDNLIISLAVLIRYFPAVKEELSQIHGAVKLRRIKGLANRLECHYVPMLVNSVQIAEELSASAITRGIENPHGKTSFFPVHLKTADYVLSIIMIGLVVIGILW